MIVECAMDEQNADCLTKGTEEAQRSMDLFKRRGYTWKIVYDPDFVAAKKKREISMPLLTLMTS